MLIQNKEDVKKLFKDRIETMYGITFENASPVESYTALAGVVRDYIYRNWAKTNRSYDETSQKQAYYFSIEFLSGKQLCTNLLNLGLRDTFKEGLEELGVDLAEVERVEHDLGLGNGGLGRLGSCFLESLASQQFPAHGCTIRYKYGLFKQKIIDNQQVEILDDWLEYGNTWEVRRPNRAVEVKFYGYVDIDDIGSTTIFKHRNYQPVMAVPHDMPVVGYGNDTVNTLRLFSAEPKREIDYTLLSGEEMQKAINYERSVESITEILYPDDSQKEGKELRLKQQYFLVSAGIQTIVNRYKRKGGDLRELGKKVAIHINDTHPALSIPEMMRVLMDEENFGWDEAWSITREVMSYTNHTILPEAFEKWDIESFRWLLPRIYMIVEEIDRRHKEELRCKYGQDSWKIWEMAIIRDNSINMAHMAIVGSHSVNGVAKVHTEILKNSVMKNFYEYYPDKFNNKTNGITHRSWLLKSNSPLSKAVTETIGDSWIKDPMQLEELVKFKGDSSFKEKVRAAKRENKERLAKIILENNGISVDIDSIFDVQVKRIHEYKRQTLNIFHILDLYYRLKDNPNMDMVPRTFIFGGKAAPGYYMAKRIINLMMSVAEMINNDKSIGGKIKVVGLENYRVSLAERIFPATDISEQISTASKEASGTGNMKFMLNGALTVGTLDGANIEIREAVGDENFFKFGLTVDEVMKYYESGGYAAFDVYNKDFRIKRVMNSLVDNSIPGQGESYKRIYETILYNNDQYFVLKDFDSYIKAQDRAEKAYRDQDRWTEMSIVNTAKSGIFSSDRTVREYADEIWGIKASALK